MSWREEVSERGTALDRWLVNEAVYAYEDWLEECTRVRAAYACWSRGDSAEADLGFAAYLSALEAEERAADGFRDASGRLMQAARRWAA